MRTAGTRKAGSIWSRASTRIVSIMVRAEVALQRRACLDELVLYGGQLGLLLAAALGQPLVCFADRVLDQVVIVEHLPESAGDGLLQDLPQKMEGFPTPVQRYPRWLAL